MILKILAFSLISSVALANPPTVVLRYSDVFDSWCSQQTGTEITIQETEKLYSIFAGLQAAWDKAGPKLLAATESLLHKPFLQMEMIGTVFLCKNTPSMSMPLLINANWFVSADPLPTDLIVDIVYHELVHTYLVDNFSELISSPLLTKYKSEGMGVLAHLHLMAIQKTVYLSLGLKDQIDAIIKFDSEHYKGAYKRAWEIVNFEGEGKFIQELK